MQTDRKQTVANLSVRQIGLLVNTIISCPRQVLSLEDINALGKGIFSARL